MVGLALALSIFAPASSFVPLASENTFTATEKAAFKRAIGDSRVVMLGELTHGDGTSHRMKTAIVKYLHQELGFSGLIWESGLFDCSEMERKMGGTDRLTDVARIGVFAHWAKGKETFPVFEYARASHKTKNPLVMAGFDLQESGTGSDYLYTEMYDWFSQRIEFGPEARTAFRAALKLAQDVNSAEDPAKAMTEARAAVMATAKSFVDALHKNPKGIIASWGKEGAFRARVVESTEAYARMLALHNASNTNFVPAYNLREATNAENLTWLLDHQFKGKKVIVWGHNMHVFRGASLPVDSTGRIVGQKLGSKMYVLGFLANGGTWSWLGGDPIQMKKPNAGSLEALLHSKGKPLGFLDLRSLGPKDPWSQELEGTVDQQNPLTLKISWRKGFDGVLYVDQMKPRVQL